MSPEPNSITVQVLDCDYQIKCPSNKVPDLQQSAAYVDKKMREIRSSGSILSIDRTAVITALNTAHDLLVQQRHNQDSLSMMNQRLRALQQKIDQVLTSKGATKH